MVKPGLLIFSTQRVDPGLKKSFTQRVDLDLARRWWCAACVLSFPCKNIEGRTAEQGKVGFDQKQPKSIKKAFKNIIGFAPRRFGVFCAHTRGRRIELQEFLAALPKSPSLGGAKQPSQQKPSPGALPRG